MSRLTSRDAGMAQLRRMSRWLAVGSFAVVGVVSVFLAHAEPGTSSSTADRAPTGTGDRSGARGAAPDPSSDFGSQAPLQGPATPPGKALTSPSVSSGAS